MSDNKVWFITGCSTGFGRELAKQLLESGYKVAVTARNADKVKDLVDINKENALAVALDVTDKRQVADAITAAESHFGRIDVVVITPVSAILGRSKRATKKRCARCLRPIFGVCRK